MSKVLFLFVVVGSVSASPFLKSLTDSSTIKLQELKITPTIFVLFQPNCSFCRKQVKDLKCLKKKYRIVLLGAFAAEKELRDEYLKTGVSFPAYFVSSDVLKQFDIRSKATPQIYYSEKGSTPISIGFKKCEELKKLF